MGRKDPASEVAVTPESEARCGQAALLVLFYWEQAGVALPCTIFQSEPPWKSSDKAALLCFTWT